MIDSINRFINSIFEKVLRNDLVIISQLIFSLNTKKKNFPIKIQFGGECEVEGRILQQRNKLYFALFSIKIRNSTRFCATGRIPFCTDHTQFFFFFFCIGTPNAKIKRRLNFDE